jgi:hypothetical protein
MDGTTRRLASIPSGDVLDIGPDGTALLAVGGGWGGWRVSAPEGSDREITSFSEGFGEISADGRSVLYSRKGGLFLQTIGGGAPVHLADGIYGQLSPDGRTVLVHRAVQGRLSLVPVGPGEEKPIQFPGIPDQDMGGITFTDSKHVLLSVAPSRRPEALYIGDLEALTAKRIPVGAAETPGYARISPDGKLFYGYRSDDHFYVYTLGGKSHRMPGIGSGDSVLGWTPDSQGFWVCNSSVVYRVNANDGKRTRWREITSSRGSISNLHITPDGISILYDDWGAVSTLYTVKGWQ